MSNDVCEESRLGEVLSRLDRVEELLTIAVQGRAAPAAKRWYTTAETARLLGVLQQTVRSRWCRNGRIDCEKDGETGRWRIPSAEVERLLNGGLPRPEPKPIEQAPAAKQMEDPVELVRRQAERRCRRL